MWRHAEGGALLKWELVIMVDLGALGTPLPGVGAGTAALHASGYHQVELRSHVHTEIKECYEALVYRSFAFACESVSPQIRCHASNFF